MSGVVCYKTRYSSRERQRTRRIEDHKQGSSNKAKKRRGGWLTSPTYKYKTMSFDLASLTTIIVPYIFLYHLSNLTLESTRPFINYLAMNGGRKSTHNLIKRQPIHLLGHSKIPQLPPRAQGQGRHSLPQAAFHKYKCDTLTTPFCFTRVSLFVVRQPSGIKNQAYFRCSAAQDRRNHL